LIRFLGFFVAIALAFWVYHDAKRRGKTSGKAVAWAVGVLFLWIVFMPLWLFTRPKELAGEGDFGHMMVCPSCGCNIDREDSFCPHCGH
jgi:hypothetical protein